MNNKQKKIETNQANYKETIKNINEKRRTSNLKWTHVKLISTRTYETSQSCDHVHLGHLKKQNLKKKVENQNISYGRAS